MRFSNTALYSASVEPLAALPDLQDLVLRFG